MVNNTNTQQEIGNTTDPAIKRTEKVLKAFSVIITVFLLSVLVLIKINVVAFPIGWFIGIMVFLIIVGIIVFFISDILKALKNKKNGNTVGSEKMPRPLAMAELRLLCRNALTNEFYCNHTKECLGEKTITLKKSRNLIYVYKTEALYKGIGDKGIVYILINANYYPNIPPSILFNPSDYELSKTINSMGIIAEDEPEERVTRRSNPLLGTEEEIIERKPANAEALVEENNKGDIQ
jgi:uncharacterized integral membrane protein